MSLEERKADATIVIAADTSQATAGLDGIKDAGKGMATSVAQSAQKAGDALDGLGKSSERSSVTFSKSESSMRASIKRATFELENLGKTASQRFEARLDFRGLDKTKFQAELAELRKLEAATLQAATGFDKMGMSARATSAALRQVPAQFTDIVTSLQGGQAPLTVLLQQGGQLKDVFGGVGAAAQALGKYVVGLVNPFTATAAAIGFVGFAAYKASEDAKALNKALALAGNSSGITIGELSKVADAIQGTGTSSSAATAALVEFVGAGVRANSSLADFVKTAIELERVGGPAVKETAKAFADLAKDPLKGLDDLTLATYKQIEALLEQGDKVGAAKLAQEAFNDANKNAVTQIEAQFGPLDKAAKYWKEVGVQALYAAGGVAQALGFGSLTGDEQRAKLQAQRKDYKDNGYDKLAADIDKQLEYFKRLDDAQKQAAENARKELELKGLLAKFDANDDSTKKLRERNQLIRDNTTLLEAGQISQERYNAALTAFDKKSEKNVKVDPAIKQAADAIDFYNDLVSKSVGYSADYEEQIGKLSLAATKLGLSYDQVAQAAAAINAKQPGAIAAAKASAAALKEWTEQGLAFDKAISANKATVDKGVEAARAYAQAIDEGIEATNLELSLVGASAAAREIALAQYRIELDLKKQIKAINENKGFSEEDRQAQTILVTAAAARASGNAASKVYVAEWKKAADQINQSIADALFRAFEDGKDFVTALRDTIVNTFKTMVLRPIVSAIVNPISGAIAGTLGLSGAANAAGDAAGGFGQLSSAKGVYDAINGGFAAFGAKVGSAFTSFATSSVGASLGLSTASASVVPSASAGYSASAVLGAQPTIAANSISASASSMASTMSTFATAAGAALAGIGIGSTIAGENKLGGLTGTESAAIGTAIGYAIAGPIGAVIGGTIGGAANRIFGKGETRLNEQGIRGTFSGGTGANAGGYYITQQDRGWFGGDGLEGTGKNGGFEKDAGLTAYLNAGIFAVTTSVKEYAKVLGLSADAVSGFSKSIDFSIKGLDAAGQQKAVADAIGGFGDAMVEALYGPALAALKRIDETTSTQTLTRLGKDITAVNSAFGLLGTKLVDTSLAGAAVASNIVAAFGGLEKFSAALGNYYDNFYNDVEKRANTVSGITKALSNAGGTFDTAQIGNLTRDAYKAIVESTKASLGADSPLYVALINASGAFASIVPAASAATTAVAEVVRSLADIANERKGLQSQLDQLTLSNAELLAQQRAALDESNRALFDQVQAAQAAKTAAQELADAQAEAAQKAADAIEAMAQRVTSALSGLGDNRFGLENQILTLQGNTGEVATRTRTNDLSKLTEGITGQAEIDRITAAYDYNTSLQTQIDSLTAAKSAAEESARAQQQAAESASRAAEQIKSAWQSATDSIFQEIKRIRALMGNGNSAQSFAGAQAAFGIAAAQAVSGDQSAAKLLPGLSQVLLTLAEAQATSLIQLRAIQGQTAGALEKIGNQYAGQYGLDIPKFATGTNYVPQDMLAIVHKGEAIVPAVYNPANGGGNNDALVAEVQALRQEIAAMRATNEAIAKATTNSDKTLTRVTRGGDAMQTQVFA